MLLLLALVPILLPLILLVMFKMPAYYTMTITALVTALIALMFWGVVPEAVLASGIQGIHRAMTIIWILIGAITFLYVMQSTGALGKIRQGFESISRDMRIQTVIIGFAFLSMIEGVSGFGTPAIVVAPLLIALGFRPVVAVCIVLISDTVACTFGAVGTPLLVGLENVSLYSPEFINQVALQVTAFDLIIATLMPLSLVYVLVMWFGDGYKKERRRQIMEVAPWAVSVGLVYSGAAFIVVRLMGVEFTAIIAGMLATGYGLISAKHGWLMKVGQTAWCSRHATIQTERKHSPVKINLSLWRAWLPYVFIVAVLLITRAIVPIKTLAMSGLDFSLMKIGGFEAINSTWQLMYSPGTILLLAALMAAWLQTGSLRVVSGSFCRAIKTSLLAASALVPTLIMVQVFTNSNLNTLGYLAMPAHIGVIVSGAVSELWLVCAPVLGALGAFIAGSATVSNLTLAAVQENIANSAGLPIVLVVAMQMLGAVAGNAIAIHNVVAVCAVAGLNGREGAVIHRVLPVSAIYIVVVVLLGVVVWLIS